MKANDKTSLLHKEPSRGARQPQASSNKSEWIRREPLLSRGDSSVPRGVEDAGGCRRVRARIWGRGIPQRLQVLWYSRLLQLSLSSRAEIWLKTSSMEERVGETCGRSSLGCLFWRPAAM